MALSANQIYELNHMNSTAYKCGLGSAVGALETSVTSITPTHKIIAAGSATTTGGSARTPLVVAAALPTDLAFVSIKAIGSATAYVATVTPGSGTLAVDFSADPGNAVTFYYQLIRLVA